jgi:hypothetical protein
VLAAKTASNRVRDWLFDATYQQPVHSGACLWLLHGHPTCCWLDSVAARQAAGLWEPGPGLGTHVGLRAQAATDLLISIQGPNGCCALCPSAGTRVGCYMRTRRRMLV